MQFEWPSFYAAAHTNSGDTAPSTAFPAFGATGETLDYGLAVKCLTPFFS